MCLYNSKYPCGKCAECLQRKRNLWSIRLQEEAKGSVAVLFGMITYDEKHLHRVVDKVTGEEYGSTYYYRDVTSAIKRFRKNHGYLNFHYFIMPEYSESGRAHYHPLFVVRSVDLNNDYLIRNYKPQGASHWRASMKFHRRFHDQVVKMSRYDWIDFAWQFATSFQREWRKGFVSLNYPKHGNSAQCVHYATKYMLKKEVVPKYGKAPRLFMSKRIGLNYLTEKRKAQHLGSMYVPPIPINGNKVAPSVAMLHIYWNDDPFSVIYFPNREHLTTLSYPELDKKEYSDEGFISTGFNFKTSYFHGSYGLPRYYRERLLRMFSEEDVERIHRINEYNFNRNYYKKYYDFMQEHGFTRWSPECDKQWNEYQRNVKTIKTDKMRNKYYVPDNLNLYG